jgi:hypothetical protein
VLRNFFWQGQEWQVKGVLTITAAIAMTGSDGKLGQ